MTSAKREPLDISNYNFPTNSDLLLNSLSKPSYFNFNTSRFSQPLHHPTNVGILTHTFTYICLAFMMRKDDVTKCHLTVMPF